MDFLVIIQYNNSIPYMEELRMTFGKVLHLLRKQGDLKQEDIAHKIGVQKNTISNYENNVSKPHYEQLVKLCNLFKVDPNYLMQDDVTTIKTPQLNPVDQYIIDHYKSLTPHDKEIVDHIFNMKHEVIDPIIKYESIVTDDVVYFPLVEQKASAGIGDPTHQWSNDTDKVAFPLNEVPEGITHAIIIDGYSMEPTFFNGQIVFINAEKDCNDGDFGIFQVITPEKTDIYCKQLKYDDYGRRYLHSVSNRADDPEFIENEETILQCIGKIISK
jgi:transcriptional regulator with XRE-family HTH domain